MNKSNIAISIIWLYALADALRQGLSMPSKMVGQNLSMEQAITKSAPILVIVPFVFFLVAGFFQRKSGYKIGMLSGYFDKKYGQGTTDAFIRNLRPATLFITGSLTLGGSGIATTFFTTQALPPYILSGFFLSAGLGLLCAYLLSIKFPPKLY
jgi:hypothetical protein